MKFNGIEEHSGATASVNLDQFETLARARRATRHFRPDPLPEGMLDRLIGITRWAPSGYNLQPTNFVLVTDAALRAKLRPACMDQPQITEAPAVVVFTGDRRVVPSNFEEMLRLEREAGSITPQYEALLRRVVPLAFGHGPLGLGWLWKATLVPLVRLVKPIPSLPAVHKRFWVTKQVMLSAMTFMHAATAAGLATLPMEGFDEGKVRKVLGIPRSHVVPVIIPVGYPVQQDLKKTRLPVERFIHRDGW